MTTPGRDEPVVCLDPNCTREHVGGAGGTPCHLPPDGVVVPGHFDHGVPSDVIESTTPGRDEPGDFIGIVDMATALGAYQPTNQAGQPIRQPAPMVSDYTQVHDAVVGECLFCGDFITDTVCVDPRHFHCHACRAVANCPRCNAAPERGTA